MTSKQLHLMSLISYRPTVSWHRGLYLLLHVNMLLQWGSPHSLLHVAVASIDHSLSYIVYSYRSVDDRDRCVVRSHDMHGDLLVSRDGQVLGCLLSWRICRSILLSGRPGLRFQGWTGWHPSVQWRFYRSSPTKLGGGGGGGVQRCEDLIF